MNLNNIFKKVTGVALAATLSFGAFAGNAFAAAPTGPINTEGSTDAYDSAPAIQKEVTGAEYFGGGTFTYTLEPGIAPAYKGFTPRTSTTPLIGLTDGKIEIAANSTTGEESFKVNQEAVDAAQTGVYRYTLKEEPSGISGMTDDNRVFDIDVFVTSGEKNTRKISYYVVSVGGQKAELKFTNKLEQNSIELTKILEGNQADFNDKFTFNIKVTPAAGTSNTSVRVNNKALDANGSDVELGHNGKLNITGLAAGDTLTITETDNANNTTKDYTMTAEAANSANEGVTFTVEGKTITATGNAGNITVTNTSNANTPTGLIENIAPFILAIAAAGIVFFVYFKRDKEEELA